MDPIEIIHAFVLLRVEIPLNVKEGDLFGNHPDGQHGRLPSPLRRFLEGSFHSLPLQKGQGSPDSATGRKLEAR